MRGHKWTCLAFTALVAAACSAARASGPYTQNQLAGQYTDARYFTSLPFGSNSQWIMPWRSYLVTQPATVFLNGLGANFNVVNQNPSLIAQMLSRHGFKRARLEVPWGSLDFETASRITAPLASPNLQAITKWAMRPLILLNGNSGGPCPYVAFQRAVTAPARAGSDQLQIDNTAGLVIGYSGVNTISSPTDPWMAEALVTAIHGNTITLSKPILQNMAPGKAIAMATLKYKPFSTAGWSAYNSADVTRSLAGWANYVSVIGKWAAATMGVNPGSADMGFDLEVWNELTFGSHFLYLEDYYGLPRSADANSIWAQVVKTTADTATVAPAYFSGVTVTDGFANTVPWPASSREPARVTGLSKHPYTFAASYPGRQQPGVMVNALLDAERSPSFIPTYRQVQPDYAGTAIQTETIVRDMGPRTNDIYGVLHGQNARGSGSPVSVMITETGVRPAEVGVSSATAALALKAKDALRAYCFYLNKGAAAVFLYAAIGAADTDFGLVQSNFVSYAAGNSTYPADDNPYVSPLLRVLSNAVKQFAAKLDPGITNANTRTLTINGLSDDHNHYQFEGDGTAAHPNLYDREVFAFLPFQVNAKRFVIPYYVATVNELVSLTPEYFTLTISGLNAVGAQFSAYDPLNDAVVPVSVNSTTTNGAQLTLLATDYPYFLIVQEP